MYSLIIIFPMVNLFFFFIGILMINMIGTGGNWPILTQHGCPFPPHCPSSQLHLGFPQPFSIRRSQRLVMAQCSTSRGKTKRPASSWRFCTSLTSKIASSVSSTSPSTPYTPPSGTKHHTWLMVVSTPDGTEPPMESLTSVW